MADQPNTLDLAQQLKKLLELSSDFKTSHYGYIQYHRWWLHPGRRAGCIWQTWWGRIFTHKASHCYAGRSVLHPLSREATVHASFRNTRSNSKLHSWASRFSNSLNLERMMISVWGRSRNVSIDYWKSSACYSHMAMSARKCLTATFFVVLFIHT